MRTKTLVRVGVVAAAAVVLGWPAWAAVVWARYGHLGRQTIRDRLVDRYLPAYEVSETHETRVEAPAALTYAATTATGLEASPVVRAIIRTRERLLGVRGAHPWPPGGIPAQLQAWGWGALAEEPGRVVILGAVTQPWEGDVQFRAISPDGFAAFNDPGFVKIVVAISVESVGLDSSTARVHTRVATTDATARARFRRYWAAFSPGILLIRRATLHEVKREAERRNTGIADERGPRSSSPPRQQARSAQ